MTITADQVFAPFTWVEMEDIESGYRSKKVVPADVVDDYIESMARVGYALSDLDEMPKGWTPETGYDNVDFDVWISLREQWVDEGRVR